MIKENVGNAILAFVRTYDPSDIKNEEFVEFCNVFETWMDSSEPYKSHKIKKDKHGEWFIEVSSNEYGMKLGIYSF